VSLAAGIVCAGAYYWCVRLFERRRARPEPTIVGITGGGRAPAG
jgi:hypothetical protein